MSGNSEAIVGRHARAIRILTCLQAGPAFNARELAVRLNVSRRTIYRDLNLIRSAGIGVLFDGESSGYRVSQKSLTPLAPPSFSDRDLRKLALTAQFSLLQGFPDFSGAVRESLSRLLAYYPVGVRESVARLLNCCDVDLPRPHYSESVLQVVEAMMTAIAQRRLVQVQMMVRKRREPLSVITRIAPYRLIAALDDWWIVGRSSYHRRTVRLPASVMQRAEVTSHEYKFPQGFRGREVARVALNRPRPRDLLAHSVLPQPPAPPEAAQRDAAQLAVAQPAVAQPAVAQPAVAQPAVAQPAT
jgi:biotin operon repressor